MPRLDYKTCKHCGGHASAVGPISWSRSCRNCAVDRAEANAEQIRAGSGPYFEHQQRRTLLVARQRLLASERAKG